MAALTTLLASRAGVSLAGVAESETGDTFSNTGAEILLVSNGGGDATITIVTSATVDGLAVADRTVTIPAGSRRAIGPFPPHIYGTTVSLTYSATPSFSLAVLKVTPEAT